MGSGLGGRKGVGCSTGGSGRLLSHSVAAVAPPEHNRLVGCPVLSVCCAVADLQSIAAAVVTSSAAVLRQLCDSTAGFLWQLMLSEMNKELKGLRCVVSGSGKIAMHVLEKLIAYGALPVSVSDSKGYLVDEDGFDYMKIQFLRYIKAQQRSLRYGGIELWVIKIRGSAFLWHHVRCMVAVLFMIGKGLESPNVIDMLLDTTSIPRKQYTMASDIPLVLQSYSGEALRVHLVNECQTYQLEAAIFHEALRNCVPLLEDQPTRGIKKKPSHVPIMLRPTEQSCEERRSKFDST
ncbi:hypothetical protein AHAS_Ahas18G0164500 [Arachis hypogaea]